jgi:isopentenyl phosphate kinase
MQVLKLGGSVLTKKEGYMELDHKNISSLSQMLSKIWKEGIRDILLIHGAGSFGHPVVIKHKIENGVHTEGQKHAMALTHSACARLSAALVDSLVENGVPAVSFPPISL